MASGSLLSIDSVIARVPSFGPFLAINIQVTSSPLSSSYVHNHVYHTLYPAIPICCLICSSINTETKWYHSMSFLFSSVQSKNRTLNRELCQVC